MVDAQDRLLGLVALQDLKSHLGDTDALPALLASEQRNVPVVNSLAERRLVGSVLSAEVLGTMAEAIAMGSNWKVK